LKDYGYAGIDDSSKVRHLLKVINTTELDVCKTQVMASPTLHDDFSAKVELYSTLINQMKAENTQLDVSEVSFARGKAGKNSFGNEIPQECQMFQTLQCMTGSLRSMNTMLSHMTKIIR
jgi:hypothetical protein